MYENWMTNFDVYIRYAIQTAVQKLKDTKQSLMSMLWIRSLNTFVSATSVQTAWISCSPLHIFVKLLQPGLCHDVYRLGLARISLLNAMCFSLPQHEARYRSIWMMFFSNRSRVLVLICYTNVELLSSFFGSEEGVQEVCIWMMSRYGRW